MLSIILKKQPLASRKKEPVFLYKVREKLKGHWNVLVEGEKTG